MNTAKRIFIALDLPESIKAFLATLYDKRIGKFQWVTEKNLHLTMRFIGDLEPDVEENLIRELQSIAVSKFTLSIEGTGVFPPRGDPKVVWAGVGSGHPNLFQLRQQVDDSILRAGIDCEMRDFVPHITLARCPTGSKAAADQFAKSHGGFQGPIFAVKQLTLFASCLSPSGPIYDAIERIDLK